MNNNILSSWLARCYIWWQSIWFIIFIIMKYMKCVKNTNNINLILSSHLVVKGLGIMSSSHIHEFMDVDCEL